MDMFKDQILAEIEKCSAICDTQNTCDNCPCLRGNVCYLIKLYKIKRGIKN